MPRERERRPLSAPLLALSSPADSSKGRVSPEVAVPRLRTDISARTGETGEEALLVRSRLHV